MIIEINLRLEFFLKFHTIDFIMNLYSSSNSLSSKSNRLNSVFDSGYNIFSCKIHPGEFRIAFSGNTEQELQNSSTYCKQIFPKDLRPYQRQIVCQSVETHKPVYSFSM